MSGKGSHRGVRSFLKFVFVSHFCAPVYPGPRLAFHWRHDPQIDQWTWRRWNGKGATGAIVGCVGLGGTILGSRLLYGPTEVDLLFGGVSLLFLLIVIIRFGSFTTLVVDSTGKLRRVGSILWMRPVVGTVEAERVAIVRGMVTFGGRAWTLWHLPMWTRDAVWIEGVTDPISHTPVVLAAGTEEEMDAYVASLPPPLRERVSEQWSSASVCYMPLF